MRIDNRGLPLALMATLALASQASATNGTVLVVPSEHPTIQSAINAALPGDTVLVEPGIYRGAGNRDLDMSGKNLVVRSVTGASTTIIDCEASFADPHRGFLIQNGETREAVIDGFTIMNGSTLQGAISDQFNGGAILIVNSSPTIANCVFRDNQGGCWGGAVYSGFSGSPLITGCKFLDNYCEDDGGAFFNWGGSTPTIESSVFKGNVALIRGGAIASFWNSQLTVRQTTIVGNSAPFGSGYLDLNDLSTITNSIVWGNTGGDQVYTNASVVSHSNIQGGFPGVGVISSNPNFRRDGYHLRFSSPCIDSGDSAQLALLGARDIDNEPRLMGQSLDMGADESRGKKVQLGPGF